MSKMAKPEMMVVRFSEEDVIATSLRMTWSNFGNGTAKDGIVIFNGVNYTMNSTDAVAGLLADMGVNAKTGVSHNGESASYSIEYLLGKEAGNGIGSDVWNGSYVYDPNASWTKDSTTYNYGVFYRQ